MKKPVLGSVPKKSRKRFTWQCHQSRVFRQFRKIKEEQKQDLDLEIAELLWEYLFTASTVCNKLDPFNKEEEKDCA